MSDPPNTPPQSSVSRGWVAVCTIVAIVVVALPIAFLVAGADDTANAERDAALARVRAATAKYKDIEVAKRDGYRRTTDCFDSIDGEGGMGVHYQNDALADDDKISLLKPEQLLYEPGKEGRRPQLVGVEYYAEFTGQRPPQIGFGPFDGPMPGHYPGQPTHYDVHVYVHRKNTLGTFNIWNPAVSC